MPSRIHRQLRYIARKTLPPRAKAGLRRWFDRDDDLSGRDHRLDAAELRKAKEAPANYDVIVLPIIDWTYRFQRPQQLSTSFVEQGHRLFYVKVRTGRRLAVYPIRPNVVGVRLPSRRWVDIYMHAHEEALPSFVKAFDEIRADYAIGNAVILVQWPFWHSLALELRRRFGWKIVYDCLDHHAGWSNTADDVVAQEHRLIADADLVTSTSASLERHIGARARHHVRIPNAGDYDHFADPHGTVIRRGDAPVVGYYGAIAEWFDVDLIDWLAQAHPDWTFVLIGHVDARATRLERRPNVHLLGEVPYMELPRHLHGFDVCLIPFLHTPLTEATDPVKVYEYLAAGKPVVATPLPELAPLSGLVAMPRSRGEWETAIIEALEDEATRRSERVEFAKSNTWDTRFAALSTAIRSAHERVSVVIVTYNNLAHTQSCVISVLERTQHPNLEIVVVDNASSDATVPYLRELAARPDTIVIENPTNAGFAAANNSGVARATGEIVILLNNDTIVTRGWATGLIRHLQNDPTIGLVGPVTNYTGNEARINVDYDSLAEMPAFAMRYTTAHQDRNFDIPMLAMFCVAMRRSTFDAVGPLDERFGVGMFEDDDYARRVRAAGLRVVCTEDVFVHHAGRASFGALPPEDYQALFERNRRLYEEKWKEPWTPHRARNR